MEFDKTKITAEDILALYKVIDLVEGFVKKNLIKKYQVNFKRIREKVKSLKNLKDRDNIIQFKGFNHILKRLFSIVNGELLLKIFFIVGGHGGVIIDDIGFCEFDSPNYAIDKLLKKMQLAIETNMPYNIEIAICCIEWLFDNIPNKISEFVKLFKLGKFEIINPTYSQPYNLIIGSESNIKQFEFGLEVLQKLGLESNIYYCSENSLHPQIPQILKGFGIKYGSLRTRLMGVNPTSNSARISWVGLDNTAIDALIDQSGVFNGELFHGTFFKEFPNLLFQAVARPFLEYIVYSSIEDFVMPQPYQEEIWRISRFTEIFGKFLSCSEAFKLINKNGEYRYSRDNFQIGNFIFNSVELYLNNKNSEICLISAEILNCVLGIFNKNTEDSFFQELWKRLLLTQAHDCYAVPFTRSGDYSSMQLSRDELKNIQIKEANVSISELSIRMHEEIQNKCSNFVNEALSYLTKELCDKDKKISENSKFLLVFNPTPYATRNLVSVDCNLENPSMVSLIGDNGVNNFKYENHGLRLISEIPGFGYKIFKFEGKNLEESEGQPSFYYDINILDDLKTIQIKYKSKRVCQIEFQSDFNYKFCLKEKFEDTVEKRKIILGKFNNQSFEVKITQFHGINRLEFQLTSNSLKEIILKPEIKIIKTFVNYPFGIEETKRSRIQTLDFMWLKGLDQGIIYIQKNSQHFKINRDNFEIKNIVEKKGEFEFAISISKADDFQSVISQVNSFYFKFIGYCFDSRHEFNEKSGSFLSIEPRISVVNLWRRESGSYIRIFNPNNKEANIEFKGRIVKNRIMELDFNYNHITILEKGQSRLGPWKIKTFQLS